MAMLFVFAGALAGASPDDQPRGAAASLGPAAVIEARDGLLTAVFSDRADDAALAAALPDMIARRVQAISLRGVPIHDIRSLAGLTSLRMLDLRGTQVRDITPLAGLPELQAVNLQFLRISDLKPLSRLVALRSLNLCGTEVGDLTPLAGLGNLQDLVLSVTKVKDLTPLIPLRQLASLDLGSTEIDDLRALSGMANLRFLSVNGTSVSDIRPLAGMVNLQTLDLGGTQVNDVRPLARLVNLRTLDLESTQVSDVKPLAGLTALRTLSLGGSRVTDLSPLARLAVAPALGVLPEPVVADAVVFWNDQTNRAIQATRADPFVASRDLALESIAVLDTIRSMRGEPAFLVRLPSPGDSPTEAAIAAAAHGVLSHLFPTRQLALDAVLASELAKWPADEARHRATDFGRAMADGVIARREEDGSHDAGGTRIGSQPGEWRPTPPQFLPPMDPQWATMTPFVLNQPNQFRTAGPPLPGSAAFRQARAVVASLGAEHSTTRTTEQTEIAHYWSDAIGTYAPAGHWNAIAANIMVPLKLGLEAEAEMFAELNVAIADATIAIADAKYTYWSWRPITAIRSGDEGEPPDPDWTPLLETPNHPSYVSGHSAVSGAAASVLNRWFGSRPFTFSSASLPGVMRSFSSFDEAAEEAAQSRVYGGIHFPFDNQDGLATGRAVGAWTLTVFQRRTEDRGPFIMVDGSMEHADHAERPITGCVLDNLAPVPAITARLDDAAPISLPVDQGGLFTLPLSALGPMGRHRIALAATSVTGRTFAVQLELLDHVVSMIGTNPVAR
jgi:Leucine-rich repeat (LRR) protein